MSMQKQLLKLLCSFFVLLIVILCVPSPVHADTFIVNSPDDSDDSSCDINHCSLREAINAANSNTGPDTISFSALDATGGDITITLTSLLPPVLDNDTTIDGATVQGYSGEPLVNIVKASGTLEHAFSIQGSSCVIRGFSLAGYGTFPTSEYPESWEYIGAAIEISGINNSIENNNIGWGAWNNSVGIHLAGGGNAVTGNTIGGNGIGIKINGPGQVIVGNHIGNDGSTANPNRMGIWDIAGSGGGHIIGGTGQGQRNIISGNEYDGINLASPNTVVQGNYIGTDQTGTLAMENLNGVVLRGAPNTLIGGASPGEGNLISGNGRGVAAIGSTPDTGSRVLGNIIGADAGGTYAIPNIVGVYAMSSGLTAGGLNPGEGNLIFGNYAGARLENEGNDNAVIGNTITMNQVGVLRITPAPGSYGFTISQNSIFDNAALGIRIYNWQPIVPSIAPPQLWNATTSSISGQACPYCIVEIFEAVPDPSGSGEGKTHLSTVTADPQGLFSASFEPIGWCQTFTATGTNGLGNTSEFSQNIIGGCFQLEPPFLYPLWIFIVLVFGLTGIRLRRQKPSRPGFLVPAGFLSGAIFGGGLLLLVNLHPGVIVHFTPQETVPYNAELPDCSDYLEPDGFSPADGAVLETLEGQELSWTVAPEMPQGTLRWSVDLSAFPGGGSTLTTEINTIPISDFGLNTRQSSTYAWLVSGEKLQPDGETWLPFCSPGERLSFQILSSEEEVQPEEEEEQVEEPEAAPTEEPEPTDEPAPPEEPEDCEPTVTALMDLNCRLGPGTGFENVGTLLEGESSLVDGQNSAGTWVWILNPDAQGHCWVWREGVEETCMPDRLQIIAEPTLEPESDCQPDLKREACNKAGGVYDVTADPPMCNCP